MSNFITGNKAHLREMSVILKPESAARWNGDPASAGDDFAELFKLMREHVVATGDDTQKRRLYIHRS